MASQGKSRQLKEIERRQGAPMWVDISHFLGVTKNINDGCSKPCQWDIMHNTKNWNWSTYMEQSHHLCWQVNMSAVKNDTYN